MAIRNKLLCGAALLLLVVGVLCGALYGLGGQILQFQVDSAPASTPLPAPVATLARRLLPAA